MMRDMLPGEATIEVRHGLRVLPSVDGHASIASAYAGFGGRHLFALADGAAGPTPSKRAAKAAVDAAIARLQAPRFPTLAEDLRAACEDSRQAARRAVLGTPSEADALVDVVLLVVGLDSLVVAGDGAVQVAWVGAEGERSLLLAADGSQRTIDVQEVDASEAPAHGGRLVMMTAGAVRVVEGDIGELMAHAPPELAARAVVDAARRRGAYGALGVHVVEVARSAASAGTHPAFKQLQRAAAARTLSADGRWLGGERNETVRSRRAKTEAGWVLWFGLAAILGAGAALVVDGAWQAGLSEAGADAHVTSASAAPDVSETMSIETLDVSPASVDTNDSPGDATAAAEIAALFDAPDERASARALRKFIVQRYAVEGEAVFERLERWLVGHADRQAVAALLILLNDPDLTLTHRWVRELLPRLWGPASPGTPGDVSPTAGDARASPTSSGPP